LPSSQKIELALDVKFLRNSFELDQSYSADIAALADILKRHDDINVNVEGHTDSSGELEYNNYISLKRAEADNITSVGKTKNRRVVAEIKLNKALKK
jgi:OOP family OmpA-OmpF porin